MHKGKRAHTLFNSPVPDRPEHHTPLKRIYFTALAPGASAVLVEKSFPMKWALSLVSEIVFRKGKNEKGKKGLVLLVKTRLSQTDMVVLSIVHTLKHLCFSGLRRWYLIGL